jgi:hypothetical protein
MNYGLLKLEIGALERIDRLRVEHAPRQNHRSHCLVTGDFEEAQTGFDLGQYANGKWLVRPGEAIPSEVTPPTSET